MNLEPRFRTTGWWRRLARGGLQGGLALLLSVLLPMQSVALAAVPKVPSSPVGTAPGKGKAVTASRWPATVDPSAKVSKQVNSAFTSANSQVTYLVKLHEKADLASAAASARKQASPAAKSLTARTAVIRALQGTAAQSQAGLLSQLDAARSKGQVTKVEPFWVANVVAVTSTRAVMQELAKRSDVAQILPSATIKLIAAAPKITAPPKVTPAVAPPKAEQKAAGDPSIMNVEWGVQRVGAPNVWSQYGIDGTGSVIAGMDTGVDWNHPALRDQWAGYDPVTGATDPTYAWYDAVSNQAMPYDDHGHGTHTMGSAVGRDPEGVNEIGVAPGARWIGVKILNAAGNGTSENILRAAQWLLAPGGDPSKAPDVVNNSWGGGPGLDDWMRDVVIAWREAGIVPIFAAGNDGSADGSISTPGNYPESFAVGATDSSDALAGFSGRGPSPYGEVKPEIAAPGVNVRSSVPGGGYEGGWNGTSMAAPHAAGTVALLRQANAALTVDEIEAILMNSAEPTTDRRYPSVPNNGFGHGILNAFTAVAMVVDGVGTVSGRVVTGGDDFEAPVIRHDPVTESFKRVPVEIMAQVSDNVSVVSAELRFRMPGMRWWGTVAMERTSGDHRTGAYTAVIPADVTLDDSLEYYIQVTDYGGNTANSGTATRPHVMTLLSGLTPDHLQDFEGQTAGWSHGGTNDSWQIGEPTSGPGSAHSGSRVAATNLSGSYQDASESYLMSPPIDLSGGPAALRFWHWYDLEENFDYGLVIGTADGGQNWDILQVFTGAQSNWQEVTVDLSPYAGSPDVFVAFYLLSDSSVTAQGWYVDDVELFVDQQPPAAPGGLTATATPTGSIALAWTANTESDLTGYRVYRSMQSGAGYQMVAETSQTSYVDAATTAGAPHYYVVTAMDFSGLESDPSAEASASPTSSTEVFRDNMEAGPGQWTTTGTGWEHGTPTSGPGAAFSGSNLWATVLAGNYPNSADASLVSPPLNLAGLNAASLQFAHWYRLESGYDRARLEISTDGGANWNPLVVYDGPAGSPAVGWEHPLIDLTAYTGQTVQIRFRLMSDSSVTYPGWYVDDVLVAGTAAGGTRVNVTFGQKYSGEKAITAKGKAKPLEQRSFAKPAAVPKTQSQTQPKTTGGVKTTGIGIQSLPLDATVTVVETGLVVRTNPVRGSYSMILPAGTFTLRAEAYGYFPQERSVTVEPDADTQATFVLQPIPRGHIEGRITDARTGDPVAGASVAVAEDMRVPAATTDADGRYMLEVLEGQYTLDVRAPGYYPASAPVNVPGNSRVTADMAVEPFVGMPGEIAYDDGTADNAWAFFDAGAGWGVRMSAPNPGQAMLIRGGRFYHWDASWPTPGGTSFQVAIFAANADGTPGRMLAGPVTVNNAVLGGWTDVDLSHLGLTVTGDFYMVHMQAAAYPNVPGLAVDESTRPSGRNWQYVGGSWAEWDGPNFMIRALVDFEVAAPTITSPADSTYTNNPAVTVNGTATAGVDVSVSVDGAEAAMVQAGAAGTWSAGLTLPEGEHALAATAVITGRGTTRPSAPVRVIVDTIAPTLALSAPDNGHSQNSRILAVSGQVSDANLHAVTVNGTRATVGGDGSFSLELVGTEGENRVAVVVTDRAGNRTEEVRTVMVDVGGPDLRNLMPDTNEALMTDDQLVVSFDAEPGLALAAFQISIGSGAASTGRATNMNLEPGEIRMTEVSPGHYEGVWTVPDGMSAPAAYVRVRAVDTAGNEVRTTAPGVLSIADNDRPEAIIEGPDTGRRNTRYNFDGSFSVDPDGRIVAYEWDMGDGTSKSGARINHRWANPGTYTVTLTVTDDKGAQGVATLVVIITR